MNPSVVPSDQDRFEAAVCFREGQGRVALGQSAGTARDRARVSAPQRREGCWPRCCDASQAQLLVTWLHTQVHQVWGLA